MTMPLLLAGLLVSCEPEQSELTLNNLPGIATIMGKVEYNPGVTKVNNAYISDYLLPAADRTVCVKIMTSQYTGGSEENEDFRTFYTTTDEKGQYSIQVPVGYHAIRATVFAIPFVGEKTVEDSENNIITLENAIFETTNNVTTWLEDQTIFEANLVMSSDKEQDVVYDQKVSLSGSVQSDKLTKDDDEIVKTLAPFSTDLIVRVNVSGPEETNIKYNTKTDYNGNYSLDMMLPNNCWKHTITVTVEKEAAISDFLHYYRINDEDIWRTQTVQVVYEGSIRMTLENRHKLVPATMSTLELRPEPANRELVKGIGNEIDEEDDIEYNNWLNW